MKQVFLLFTAIFLSFATFAQVNLNEGLVAHYPFNGNANDESGNGNNGFLHGNMVSTSDRLGNIGKAYSFDGLDDYIHVPYSSSMALTSWTISSWVKVNSFPNSHTAIVSKNESPTNKYNYAIVLFNAGYFASEYESCSDEFDNNTNTNTVQLDEWINITSTRNNITGDDRIFINGVIQDSQSHLSTPCANSETFFIGASTYSLGEPNYFHGIIDDIRIYNRALNEQEIQTLYTEPQPTFSCGQPFTDSRDGQSYETVPIGNQCWMKENLKWLPEVSPSTAGSNTEPYYYVYNYQGTNVTEAKSTDNYQNYGVLYNWQASLNACPVGWHLPSDLEWCTLTQTIDPTISCSGTGLGGTDAGGRMKSQRTAPEPHPRWDSPNSGANNSSGFTGLPGGYRSYNTNFLNIGKYGYWWSSSEASDVNVWNRILYNTSAQIDRSWDVWRQGFSVRCIKEGNIQSTNLNGNIYDQQNQQPIEGAQISLLPIQVGYVSISNQNGFWQILNIPSGNGYTLEIIKEGYEILTLENLNFQAGQTYTLDYELTPQEAFIDYRVIPVTLAPNPTVIEVPEGGTGYGWFVLEGKDLYENWLPVPAAAVEIIDGQGNPVYGKDGEPVKTNFLFYKFMTAAFHMQNAGVFGVPVDWNILQDGSVGSSETITIIGANGEEISPENQQAFIAEVIPYQYTQSWGYRIYAKGGVGVGGILGGIASANVFAGGGSGAVIQLDLQGLNETPDWSNFQIHRKDDIFVGAEVSVGPPSLLEIGVSNDRGASAGVTASFPYQTEYEFDMDELEGLEAAMAFYLFYEPGIIYATGALPAGQIGVNFLSWLVEVLIANSAQNGLGIVRTADQTGIDIEGTANLSAAFGVGISNSLELESGPSLGVYAHFGGNTRITTDEIITNSLYIGGGYETALNKGPKILSRLKRPEKFFYPNMFLQPTLPSQLSVEFEGSSTLQNDQWQNIVLTGSIESNSALLNIYNMKGQYQKYSAWLEIDDNDVKNMLVNTTSIVSKSLQIGTSAVQAVVDDNSFKEDFSNFLGEVYEQQNNDLPVIINYGFDATDRNQLEIDMTVQFPLPVFPAIDIVIGGGYQHTKERQYALAQGYWVKGLPYLQTEMPSPPEPQETFGGVMTELWDNVTNGDIFQELVDVIIAQITNSRFFRWLGLDSETQLVELNEQGTTLQIRENSIPANIDSVFCRQWDWGEEPTSRLRDSEQVDRYKRYVDKLRDLREEAVGMHYGIGGFYRFEPVLETFGDSTYLSIVYPDTAVSGFDENSLSMYWEDSLGIWHPLESYIEPDSNRVSAWIENFATYTLAPTMPSGQYGLITEPDSIPSDGVATALVSSPILLNNDSTQIEESTLFTVETSRGTILTGDSEPSIDGIQVPVSGGTIQFEVQADSIPNPIYLYAKSISGYAKCEGQLILFDTIPPAAPTNLSLMIANASVHLLWNEVNEPDIAGYKVYFDTDSIPPYNGIVTVWGEPSPVGVGKTDHHQVLGLFNDTTYYFTIIAVDVAGNESEYSLPIEGTPLDLVEQRITITEGWSGLSSYLNPLDENTAGMLEPIINELVILQNEVGVYWPEQNINTIGNWNPHDGYLIKLTDEVTLTITGVRDENKTISLNEGWNLIPVLSKCEVDVATTFVDADLIIIKEAAGWNVYWPEMGINTLETMQPGKAYFILMNDATEITFPDCE
ncbi:MAG: carboxypeptidase regulatory-like domain-containing protein [Bacteroidales bacterium]|nr:carboxypeptidase regulatory-like domain-containing protein [Bacteroidales bacterium]